jgi:hypothetical protein
MNTKAVAFIAIVAVVALVFTAAIVAQAADARRHHNRVSQSSSSFCVNTNARCQTVTSQNAGSDISSVTAGIQP